MEYRYLGRSGFRVPVLGFGAGTFGGKGPCSAVGWSLTAEQVSRLDAVSAVTSPYPYYPCWNGQFTERNPPPV